MLEKPLAFGDSLKRITSLQPWWEIQVPPARAGFSYQPRLQCGEERVREMSQRTPSNPEQGWSFNWQECRARECVVVYWAWKPQKRKEKGLGEEVVLKWRLGRKPYGRQWASIGQTTRLEGSWWKRLRLRLRPCRMLYRTVASPVPPPGLRRPWVDQAA